MTRGKYDREYKARQDKLQAQLNPQSLSFIKKKPKPQEAVITTYEGEYYCPFCLHKDRMEKYLISTKKGYDRRLGLCPECKNKMMIKTLVTQMTPEQFAEFAYDYRMSGYWQKVPFSTFNKRLWELGIAERFWTRYRALKGEDDTESYQDYIMRKQQEEHEAGDYGEE